MVAVLDSRWTEGWEGAGRGQERVLWVALYPAPFHRVLTNWLGCVKALELIKNVAVF